MKRFNLFSRLYFHKACSALYYIPITLLLLAFAGTSCHTLKPTATEGQSVEMNNDNDSTEYSLIVLDPGYESYLAMQPSAHFYSQQYYESWNQRYVMEWNTRHRNPLQYGGFYETEINYNAREDYGLDLNYRLYYYFLFIRNKYGITLIDRGRW